jgi:amidase
MTAADTSSRRISAFTDDALGTDDATGVAERIASGEISAQEAVDAAIARVESVNGELNAVAAWDQERARRRASAGRVRGAFAGVPTATKDNIHVAGMPTTMGSRAVPSQPSDVDGAFTRQFLDTGVIPVCSTTMPEF